MLPGVPDDRVLTDRAMPGAVWFPGTTVNFAEQALRWATDEHPALIVAAEDARAGRGLLGDPPRPGRRLRRHAAPAGRRPRRPGGRLPAQRARGGRRLPRGGVDRRGVVLLRARTSAPAPSSTGSPRSSPRCWSPSTATASTARTTTAGTSSPSCGPRCRPCGRRRRPPAVPRRGARRCAALGRGRRRRAGAGVRGAALRPPAVDRLLVGHHRAAQGDRARARRASCSSSASRLALHMDVGVGDRFFWYASTAWIMWNIATSALLCGATVVVYDGAPTYPSVDALFASGRAHGHHLLRHEPRLPRRLREGRRAARRAARPVARCGSIGVTGSPAALRRRSGGSTTR